MRVLPFLLAVQARVESGAGISFAWRRSFSCVLARPPLVRQVRISRLPVARKANGMITGQCASDIMLTQNVYKIARAGCATTRPNERRRPTTGAASSLARYRRDPRARCGCCGGSCCRRGVLKSPRNQDRCGVAVQTERGGRLLRPTMSLDRSDDPPRALLFAALGTQSESVAGNRHPVDRYPSSERTWEMERKKAPRIGCKRHRDTAHQLDQYVGGVLWSARSDA